MMIFPHYKAVLFAIALNFVFGSNIQAQNDGAAVAAGVTAGILSLGSTVLTSENYKSRLRRSATEWFLRKHGDVENFQLRALDYEAKRGVDKSNTSIQVYTVEEVSPKKLPKATSVIAAPTLRQINEALTNRKWVLLAFIGDGWVNETGMSVSRVQWLLMDKEEWLDMVITYLTLATGNNDRAFLRKEIVEGKITYKGIRNEGISVPFYSTGFDMYLSTNYNQDIKLVFNKMTMGFFLRATGDLLQMSRDAVVDINNYFFG